MICDLPSWSPLLLPLSLPLTERQSGLLFPPLQYSAITGFGTEVPLFLTLGRSYDATVAPGFFTSSGGNTTAVPGTRGVAGPRLGLQFRYAPAERTEGQIDLDLVHDSKADDSLGSINPGLGYFVDGQYRPGESRKTMPLVQAANARISGWSFVLARALRAAAAPAARWGSLL